MYARFMRNTTFDIVKMFLGSSQLAFRIYQIPIEHTVCYCYYKAQLWGYQNKLTKKIQFLNELKPCESSGIYLNNIDTIFTYFYDGSLSISNYNSHQVPLIEHFLNGISPLSHWICKLTQIRKARNNFLQRNVPYLINASFNDVLND